MTPSYLKLNVSNIARELVYGSKPRIPDDKVVTYGEMRSYVNQALSIAFGKYIHGLAYGRSKDKFNRTYQSKKGINYNITAVPDSISLPLITEEKCTFNYYKTRDLVGDIQLQLEGYVCNAKLGILKIRHIQNNTILRHVITLDELMATHLIEKYIEQTLLPYLTNSNKVI